MLSEAVEVLNRGAIHGKGLVALRPIPEGEVIWRPDPGPQRVPVREVLSWPEERRRAFLYVAYQADGEYFAVCGDDSRYMNHSCDPNTWWEGDVVVARRAIAAGEEITYDYAMTELAVSPDLACSCGSPLCRGRITNRDHLDPAWRARYGRHLPAHLLRAVSQDETHLPNGIAVPSMGSTPRLRSD